MEPKVNGPGLIAALRRLDIRIKQFIVHIIQDRAAVYDLENGAECILCGQTKARVRKTARPMRSHKCQNCGLVFQSVEKKVS